MRFLEFEGAINRKYLYGNWEKMVGLKVSITRFRR